MGGTLGKNPTTNLRSTIKKDKNESKTISTAENLEEGVSADSHRGLKLTRMDSEEVSIDSF